MTLIQTPESNQHSARGVSISDPELGWGFYRSAGMARKFSFVAGHSTKLRMVCLKQRGRGTKALITLQQVDPHLQSKLLWPFLPLSTSSQFFETTSCCGSGALNLPDQMLNVQALELHTP